MNKLKFLNDHKIPYLYIDINIMKENNELKKKISGIPKKWSDPKTKSTPHPKYFKYYEETNTDTWTEWDYDTCTKFNKEFGCKNGLNINLSKSDFMIIDIDKVKDFTEEQNEELKNKYLELYGNNFITYSTRYKFPHLWRQKHKDDMNTNKTGFKDGLDLLYKTVFEFSDGIIENYNGDIPIFSDFPKPKTRLKIINKKKENNPPVIINKNTNLVSKNNNSDLLQMIPNNGNIDYDTWLKIIFCLKNDCESNYDIALNWSMISERHSDEHFNHVWNYSKPKNSIGTLYYYANHFSPFEYRKFILEKSISSNDEYMANTFINLQCNNVIYSNECIYIYKNNFWIQDDKKNLQLKKIIRETLLDFGLRLEIQNNNNLLNSPDENLQNKKKQITEFINYVSSSNKINNVCSFILQDLASKNQNIEFDLGEEQKYNLHFRNGVFDLKSKKFRKRTQNDYITKFLDWDYNPKLVSSEIKKELNIFYKKLQPNETQRKFSLQWLAYCLSGSTGKQKFKMNIGYSASNGKSTEFKIHDKVFDIYSFKLSKDTFDLNNDKAHKQLIHVIKNPIRFAYCEELKTNKLDVDLLKDFVDGDKLNVEIMYGTSEAHSIQCKLNTCSNNDFNLDIDEGIIRRGMVQYYTSQFKRGLENDDYEKHKYKVIENYANRFNTEEYKNAYLQLLLDNYDENFEAPKENTKAFSEILDQYDEYGDALSHFEITNDEDDVINKNDILMLFKNYLGKTNLKWRDLLSTLKARGISYNKEKKHNKIKGCCIGIKHIEEEEEEDKDFLD